MYSAVVSNTGNIVVISTDNIISPENISVKHQYCFRTATNRYFVEIYFKKNLCKISHEWNVFYTTYVCISGGKEMFVFLKIWRDLFSCYLRFEILLFCLITDVSMPRKYMEAPWRSWSIPSQCFISVPLKMSENIRCVRECRNRR